jgi:serine/threonine protein kinase
MMFGRYRVLGELGRGAIGTVYRALDPLIEREVAVKALNPNLPEDIAGEVRVRFLREAKSAGRLNHVNIVAIYDVGEQGRHRVHRDGAARRPHAAGHAARSGEGCRCKKPRTSRHKSPKGSTTRITSRSCIATSSPRTSWFLRPGAPS